MKNSIYVFILYAGLLFHAEAQGLVDKSNKWNVVINPTFTPDYHSYSVRLIEDTLINGFIYDKIYYSFDSMNSKWIYQEGMLREDSSGKIFYRTDIDPEIILYDFSLKANDTFRIDPFCTLTVDAIDMIILNNGEKRKRITLSKLNQPNWGTTHWIEGIGSELGLISHFRFCHTDYADELLCYYRNDSLLYPKNPKSCFITTDLENVRTNNFVISPNPFQSFLEIDNEDSKYIYFEIYNLEGTLLIKGNIQESNSKIDLNDLLSGVYIIKFQSRGGVDSINKIIKI